MPLHPNKPFRNLPATSPANVTDYVMLMTMGLGWGLALSTSKIGGEFGGHPIGMALWQVCVSGGLLAVISVFAGGLPRLTGSVIRFGAVCGICGVGFPAMALFWSALYLPAGIVAIAFASMPLFTYLLSVIFGLERPELRRLLGVVAGLCAMLIMIVPQNALPSPDLAPWVLLALAASVSMAIENFYAGAFRPAKATSLQLSCVRQVGAVVVLAPLALITATTVPALQPWGMVQWAVTATGILSGMCYTLLLLSIQKSGVVFASQSSYLITLAGVGWGMLIFGETHSAYVWITLALTLAGIALVKPRTPRAGGLAAHASSSNRQHPKPL